MSEHTDRGSGVGADPWLMANLQALLFISEEGLSDERLAAAVDHTLESTRAALAALQGRLEEPGSGIVLREHASGWRLTTASGCAEVLERFVIDGHSSRLSPAALETLAVVAYQQPVSRGRIAAIRGVAVDGVMRTLVARGLVEEAGAETSGAILYATTSLFMDKLGVKSLTELPELAPLLPDIETLDGFDDRPEMVPPAGGAPVAETEGTAEIDRAEDSGAGEQGDESVGLDNGLSSGRPVSSDPPGPLTPATSDQPAETSQRGVQPYPNGDADGDEQ